MLCPSCRAETFPGAASCGSCGRSVGGLVPGTLFASRYEILASLGQGGMGVVYKARDRELEEVVALKVLRADVAGTPEMERRFRSEIKLARRVSHRNVCRLHDYGSAEGQRYVCMAYVEGVDLKRVLASRGALPPDGAYDVCAQVAEGLQAIHDEGIVHRDLKSSNIMIDPRGIARLMDFGIAKSVEPGLAHGVTATGVIVGTPEYMSPEQALGGRVDTRSDLYSLGVVIFEAFTGHVPFRGDTPVATILLHVQQPPPLEGPGAAGLPREVVPLLRRALAKSPGERPAAAREIAEGLRAAWGARAGPGAVTPVSPPTLTVQALAVPARPPVVSTTTSQSSTARPASTLGRQRKSAPRLLRALGAAAAATLLVVGITGVLLLWPPSRSGPANSSSPESMSAPRGAGAQPSPTSGPRPNQAPPDAAEPSAVGAPLERAGSSEARPSTPRRPAEPAGPSPGLRTGAGGSRPEERSSPSIATPASTPTPPATAATEPRMAEAQAYLVVVAVPWADVSLDGTPVKTVPLRRLALSPGQHVVRFAHPDYEPLQRTVTLRAGETVNLTVDLPEEGVRIGK